MKLSMFATAMLLGLVLAACNGCSGISTHDQQVEASCATATTTIQALTVANQNHKLSTAQQAEVQKAIAVVSPVCMAPSPPTNDELKNQGFVTAVALLQNVLAGVK